MVARHDERIIKHISHQGVLDLHPWKEIAAALGEKDQKLVQHAFMRVRDEGRIVLGDDQRWYVADGVATEVQHPIPAARPAPPKMTPGQLPALQLAQAQRQIEALQRQLQQQGLRLGKRHRQKFEAAERKHAEKLQEKEAEAAKLRRALEELQQQYNPSGLWGRTRLCLKILFQQRSYPNLD